MEEYIKNAAAEVTSPSTRDEYGRVTNDPWGKDIPTFDEAKKHSEIPMIEGSIPLDREMAKNIITALGAADHEPVLSLQHETNQRILLAIWSTFPDLSDFIERTAGKSWRNRKENGC